MTTDRRLPQALSVYQAAGNSPSLARLTELVQESSDRLKAIESLLPEALRPAVQAGPIDGETWCLLVNGNAAAAKIRQLLPYPSPPYRQRLEGYLNSTQDTNSKK
jgi:hypothetical protein